MVGTPIGNHVQGNLTLAQPFQSLKKGTCTGCLKAVHAAMRPDGTNRNKCQALSH